MANTKGLFPRAATIVGQAGLWLALVAVIVFNAIYATTNSSKLSRILFQSLQKPYSISAHVDTAKKLWDAGFHESATRELVIAKDLLTANGSVLGATTEPTSLLTTWEQVPVQLKAAYEYWSQMTKEKPDYRDGYLLAGSYAYQLGDVTRAISLFRKAYNVDPNYKPTLDMLAKTEK